MNHIWTLIVNTRHNRSLLEINLNKADKAVQWIKTKKGRRVVMDYVNLDKVKICFKEMNITNNLNLKISLMPKILAHLWLAH